MARPSILNDKLIADFCLNLRITGSVETAIAKSGIGRASYYRWKRKIQQGGGTELEQRFVQAVDQAEGEVKLAREHQLSKHFDKKWRAIAWWLERKYPDEYGRRRKMPPLPDSGALAEQRNPDIVWMDDEPAPKIKVRPVPAKPAAPPEGASSEPVERISCAWVAGNYYETFGREPITGRLLTLDDDRPDAPPVAVITDGYWARRFGRDLKVIGQRLRIEGVPVTIVGVSAPEFTSTAAGSIADLTMAVGVMPQIPPGGEARMIGVNYWMLKVILPDGLCSPPQCEHKAA